MLIKNFTPEQQTDVNFHFPKTTLRFQICTVRQRKLTMTHMWRPIKFQVTYDHGGRCKEPLLPRKWFPCLENQRQTLRNEGLDHFTRQATQTS